MPIQQLLEKAISIALLAHKGQMDKGGCPYILHPLRVMFAMETTEEKIVALLHDVVEDSGTTIQNLSKENFPKKILIAIDLLTKKDNQNYEEYILAIKKNPLASRVKKADLKDNMDKKRLLNISVKDEARLKKYRNAYKILIS